MEWELIDWLRRVRGRTGHEGPHAPCLGIWVTVESSLEGVREQVWRKRDEFHLGKLCLGLLRATHQASVWRNSGSWRGLGWGQSCGHHQHGVRPHVPAHLWFSPSAVTLQSPGLAQPGERVVLPGIRPQLT